MSKLLFNIFSLRNTIYCIALILILTSAIIACFHYHDDGKIRDDCPLCRLKFVYNSYIIKQNFTFITSYENYLTCFVDLKEYFYKNYILFHSYPNAPPCFPA